jgi:alkanesulfonate monooxygenase SsuD/methylene tetrahydromethanopterin reductase-like flavin-dependent oxidoreductase (luciferase family)
MCCSRPTTWDFGRRSRHSSLRPTPVSGCGSAQTHVPIMVGGNGNGVLKIAARHADIVGLTGFSAGTGRHRTNLTHFTWDGLADRVARLRATGGERADSLELSVLVQWVETTDRRAARAAELAQRYGQPIELVLDSPFVMVGSVGELTNQLHRLRDQAGVTYVTVLEPCADALVPAIERLR